MQNRQEIFLTVIFLLTKQGVLINSECNISNKYLFVWRIVKLSATPQNDTTQMVSDNLKSFGVACLAYQQFVEFQYD